MAPLDTKYPDQYDLRLVESQSDLKDMVEQIKQSKRIAIDTETTHVDWGYGHVVGISVAATDETGWYVPFLHENYEKNLPLSILPKLFPLFLHKKVLMYNAPFDEIMLNKEGWDCFKLDIRDVMDEVYLMDTNVHLPSLKYAERLFLGIEAPTFEETLKGRDHFGFVTPEEARIYAGTDAWGTRRLDTLLYPRLKQECPNAMKLDNAFVPILLKLNSNKMSIRTELLDQMLEYYKVEKKKLEKEIFDEMEYPFNLNSNKQLEIAFKQQGINTGYKTDKGNMSLKSEVLDLIAPKHPFVKKIIKYKSMSSIESALKKFKGKDYIRCNYEMYNTVSGRMSSGSSKESAKAKLPKNVRSWFDPFNAQNFKKNKEILYRGIYSPNDPYAIMGYRFEHVEKDQVKPDDKIVEAMDYRGNTRRLVHAGIRDEEGNFIADESTHYFVKCDYSGAELRLATLFSKEPVLLKAFVEGIDPHTNTAQMMFGVGDKAHRAKAKTCLGEKTLVRTNHGLKYPYELTINDKLEDENGNFVDWLMDFEDNVPMVRVYYNNGLSEEYDPNHKVMVYDNGKIELKAIKDITVEGIIRPEYNGNWENYKEQVTSNDCIYICNKKEYTGKKFIIEVLTERHLYKTQNSLSLNCNFSLLYLGTPDSLCRNSGLEIKEATDLWNQYWKTMRGLKSWQVKEIQKANVTGRCATAFGRPRRLGWYFRNPDPKMRSFAKRSTISHEVQGSLGDIIKMTLIKLYKNILENPVWQERKIAFDLVVHDEADCIVPKKHIQEYLDTFLELGKVQLPNWEFPLELSPEVGSSYGFVLPVFKDTDGIWKIEFKEGSKFIS